MGFIVSFSVELVVLLLVFGFLLIVVTTQNFHNGKKQQQFLHSRLIFYIKTLRF